MSKIEASAATAHKEARVLVAEDATFGRLLRAVDGSEFVEYAATVDLERYLPADRAGERFALRVLCHPAAYEPVRAEALRAKAAGV
jgi:hypothetical protein